MSWLEVSFDVSRAQAQTYSTFLEELGAVSVSFLDAGNQPILEPAPGVAPLWDQLKMVGLFSDDLDLALLENKLASTLSVPFLIQPLADQEWSRLWLDHFHPMCFGENLWIIPSETPLPVEVAHNATLISLDPGLAFGSGTHATTALCLTWLDRHPPQGQTVVDYGCGSGILSIAALKLGAHKVYAVDYDPQALLATQENAKRNQLDENTLIACHPQNFLMTKAQTVLANILAEPLISLATRLKDCCEVNGYLVMSGFLPHQVEPLKAAYEEWFIFDTPTFQEEWGLLVGKRKNAST